MKLQITFLMLYCAATGQLKAQTESDIITLLSLVNKQMAESQQYHAQIKIKMWEDGKVSSTTSCTSVKDGEYAYSLYDKQETIAEGDYRLSINHRSRQMIYGKIYHLGSEPVNPSSPFDLADFTDDLKSKSYKYENIHRIGNNMEFDLLLSNEIFTKIHFSINEKSKLIEKLVYYYSPGSYIQKVELIYEIHSLEVNATDYPHMDKFLTGPADRRAPEAIYTNYRFINQLGYE